MNKFYRKNLPLFEPYNSMTLQKDKCVDIEAKRRRTGNRRSLATVSCSRISSHKSSKGRKHRPNSVASRVQPVKDVEVKLHPEGKSVEGRQINKK